MRMSDWSSDVCSSDLEQVDRDRVRISGTKGEPPPSTLKVAMNELGGFRNEVGVGLVGLDIEEKAALVEAAFWEALPYSPEDYASVKIGRAPCGDRVCQYV